MAIPGTYFTRKGKASDWSQRKSTELRAIFGCPMVGSFNIQLSKPWQDWPEPAREIPDYDLPGTMAVTRRFWLVRVKKGDEYFYGYWQRYTNSRTSQKVCELWTKQLVPELFKEGTLEVEVMAPSLDPVREAAGLQRKWFQQHWFLPRRMTQADNQKVWDESLAAHSWAGTSVLDIGCATGFYAFEAARVGATCVGIDKNKRLIRQAQWVNEHVEMQDVKFQVGDMMDLSLLDPFFDTILCMSAYHYPDPSYGKLSQYVERLKRKCKHLFIELIVPPLAGPMSEKDVGNAVEGVRLFRYKSRVRKYRSVYYVKGLA